MKQATGTGISYTKMTGGERKHQFDLIHTVEDKMGPRPLGAVWTDRGRLVRTSKQLKALLDTLMSGEACEWNIRSCAVARQSQIYVNGISNVH